MGRPVRATTESVLRIELENGSRIVALPCLEANIRPYSGVTLLVIDGAARVSDKHYKAVRPRCRWAVQRAVIVVVVQRRPIGRPPGFLARFSSPFSRANVSGKAGSSFRRAIRGPQICNEFLNRPLTRQQFFGTAAPSNMLHSTDFVLANPGR
jgi:hypothetical protein